MKRLVGFCALAAMVLWVCGSHSAWGLPPAGKKTLLCHVDEDTGTGVVIEVGNAAVAAHCKNHGDYTAATVAAPTPTNPNATAPVTLVKGQSCPTTVATSACVAP
jgi:hypothetical protein